uniref:Uncharacterized protein n=1 Tax=Esox lucius TaxID=8010 RepID=A0AAY5L5A6_ESOLU
YTFSSMSCMVSDWTDWSGYVQPYAATFRLRNQQILQVLQNGGEILKQGPPWALSPLGNVLTSMGIWLNKGQMNVLFSWFYAVPALITTGGKCPMCSLRVRFNVKPGHSIRIWRQYLREAHQVCVECQPPALAAGQRHCSGEGEDERGKQSLQAVGNPRCDLFSCPTIHSFLFI